MSIGVWTAQVWNECARQVHQVAECVRHSIGDPLLNARRLNRRRAVGLPASCAGRGDFSASFGGAGSVDCRSGGAGGFAGAFALVRDFCSDGLPGGFFFESIFGADGPADSFDTDAVRVAFGFGVSARGAEAVEAAVDGAVAIGALSGLIICEAADGAAVFEAPARGGDELGGAGADGAVAIGGPFGLIACKAADGAAVFGASATGGVELVRSGGGGRRCDWRPVRPDRLRGCRRGGRLWRLSQRRG